MWVDFFLADRQTIDYRENGTLLQPPLRARVAPTASAISNAFRFNHPGLAPQPVLDSSFRKVRCRVRSRRSLLLAALGVALSARLWAPDARSPAKSDPHVPDIRVNVTFIQIPVTVLDPLNRFVTGLTRDNFILFEDRVQQTIQEFASEDAPLSVGLVFDTSASMGVKMKKSRQAVAAFLKIMTDDDETFLIEFNDRPELTNPFTRHPEEILHELKNTRPKGRTALLDGVTMALRTMKKARNARKCLLIISDGGDNNSRYTESEVRRMVLEADTQIYAIGIFEPPRMRRRTKEEWYGPTLLHDVAEQTGGHAFNVANLNELPDIADRIAQELRNRYLLGYAPTNQERDGQYRRVEIQLDPPKLLPPLRAYWRPGYYAPSN